MRLTMCLVVTLLAVFWTSVVTTQEKLVALCEKAGTERPELAEARPFWRSSRRLP